MCDLGERSFHSSAPVLESTRSARRTLTYAQGSELVSSFIARQVMFHAFKIDVSQVGMDEMREFPELGASRVSRGKGRIADLI